MLQSTVYAAIYGRARCKIWHVVGDGSRALCNARLVNPKLIYTKALRPGERLCRNCKGLLSRKKKVWTPEKQQYYDEWKAAREADARGDYDHLPGTEEIVEWISRGWQVKDFTAHFMSPNPKEAIRAALAEAE